MSEKLYYYCISPNEGLIKKSYDVTLKNDSFSGPVYEKTGWSPMTEPYTYVVEPKDIGRVDARYMSVYLLEDNPEEAIHLLQAAIRKKMLPLQKMAELLEVEEKELQYKLAQEDLEEAKELRERFRQIVDTLETMCTMPEYTYKMLDFVDSLKDRQIWHCFTHRQKDGTLPVTISASLTRANHNDIYRAVVTYDDSSTEYPIITWHGSLEEFEAIVKEHIPEALEYTDKFEDYLK